MRIGRSEETDCRSVGARIIETVGLFLSATVFAVFVLLGHFAFAQSGTVHGVARDALQRPLDGVGVRLETADGKIVASAVTRADGHFVLGGVAPGVYSLVGKKKGFAAAVAIVTVTGNGADADLTLASTAGLDLQVTAQRLSTARTAIEPRIGATTYTLSADAI